MVRVPALVVLLAATAPAFAATPLDGVVKLTSHGGSGTVIWKGQQGAYILSAHHMFSGKDQNRPVVIEAPHPQPSTQQKVSARCVGVDAGADLALVLVQGGTFPYVTPVAPRGHRPGNLISCGYDRLQWHAQGPVRATARPAHLLAGSPYGGNRVGYTHAITEFTIDRYTETAADRMAYTRELPWHGRSGGGLIDVDNGVLIGVVSGYSGASPKTWAEVKPGAHGIYASHEAILDFLTRTAPQALQPPAATPQVYGPQQPQGDPFQEAIRQMQIQQQEIDRRLQAEPGRPYIQEWHETPDGRRRQPFEPPPLQQAPYQSLPAQPQQYQQPIVYRPPPQSLITPLTGPGQQAIPQQQPYCPPGGT